MICPNPDCKRIVSPYDETCKYCGTTLKEHPVKDYTKKADRIVKDAEARAEDIKEQIKNGYKERSFSDGTRTEKAKIASRRDSETKIERNFNFKEEIHYEEMSTSDAIKRKIQRVLDRTKIQLEEIKDEIFKTNPHVTKNYVWQDKAEKTFLNVNWKDNTINAGAYALEIKDVELSEGKYRYGIEINGGYVNFAYAISTAFVGFVPNEGMLWDDFQLGKVIKLAKSKGGFSFAEIIKIMREGDTENIKTIGEYAFKLLYRTVGHELGHICYGHIHSGGYYNNSIATNHGGELDADSFSYAIIGSSDESEELWVSLIMFSLIQLTIKIMNGVDLFEGSRTHPAPIVRFKQAIIRFPTFAEKYKINEEWAVNEIIKLVKLTEMKPILIPKPE